MSTDDEIAEVYMSDIANKNKIVRNKQGMEAFLRDISTQKFNLFDGVLSQDDIDLLKRIYAKDQEEESQE